jgi:hypothetical protein
VTHLYMCVTQRYELIEGIRALMPSITDTGHKASHLLQLATFGNTTQINIWATDVDKRWRASRLRVSDR